MVESTKKEWRRAQVLMPSSLYRRVRMAAAAEDLSISEFLRKLVTDKFKKR